MTPIFLWLPPRADADQAISLGMITQDYDAHVGRIHETAASLDEDGYEVEVVVSPVEDLLAVLAELGLANDPKGRAAAAAEVARRRS